MRNLHLLQDSIFSGLISETEEKASDIVSICRDIGSASVFILTQAGCLSGVEISDSLRVENQITLCSSSGEKDDSWFDATVVGEIGAVVCISHSGTIISVREDPQTGRQSDTFEQEGDVDGGIAAASWNPDASNLVIVTNNDSILLMTAYWDVLEEITLPSRVPNTPCSVSWRGDGEFLSVLTVDKELSLPQVRVYSKKLELISVGRNIADGAASVLRGLGTAVSYATNGSLIALSQKQGKSKHQIAFIEKNGLRHLEFDIQCPPVPEGSSEWDVCSLHWDLPSTLLAVGLSRTHNNETVGAVQLYYRGNYHWYLKQQWVESDLKCLGFDTESVGRLFMVQSSVEGSSDLNTCARSALRVVDLSWDVTVSGTADGSVAVVDGCSVLLTPLAVNTVPPPMSMYKHILSNPCRQAFFWPRPDPFLGAKTGSEGGGWGLACLCADNTVQLVFSTPKGAPDRHVDVNVPAVLASLYGRESPNAGAACAFVLRGIAATEESTEGSDGAEGEVGVVCVLLYGSRAVRGWGPPSELCGDEDGAGGQPDYVLTLRVRASDGAVLSVPQSPSSFPTETALIGGDARVSRIALWPGDPACLAVSYISGQDSFDVRRVRAGIEHVVSTLHGLVDAAEDTTQSGTSCPPEPCVQIALIPAAKVLNSDQISDTYSEMPAQDIAMGLTARGKLFCGETLIVAGVSSIAVNYPLQVLLYISTGTRPMLHFCSFEALRSVDPLRGEAWEDQQQAAAMQGAEPRPVERGARLVLAAPGSPKVVLQMPRGNLEGFEPRPLIFLRAKALIDALNMLDCLLLLRRQKVDLNYLVDYNPVVFLSQVDSLVKDAMASNPDLLSLLVSSLEPGDTTAFKYPTQAPEGTPVGCVTWRETQLPQRDFYCGSNKVNIVCTAVRASLLRYLNLTDGPRLITALNPALCTYAKQSPPLLADALALIKDLSSTSNSTSTGATDATENAPSTPSDSPLLLPPSKVPAAIKYLAFLAEGSALFECALGGCDFDMARAVARQCQMDPKAYLPLLKSFEDLGISPNEGPGSPTQTDPLTKGVEWRVAHMHFAVCVHLKKQEEAIEWCAALFKTLWLHISTHSTDTGGVAALEEGKIELLQVMDQTFRIVAGKETYFFAFALPILVRLLNGISVEEKQRVKEGSAKGCADAAWVVTTCKEFLSKIRVSYGDHCLKKLQYNEAVAAYLSAQPPRASDAVKAGRLLGDWQLALMIAGRYGAGVLGGGGGGGEECSDLDPKRVAFEIVSAFKEGLEQGESGVFDDADADLMPVGLGSGDGEGAGTGGYSAGKALEAAQMSVEYCNDSESAVSILLLSSKWTAAAQIALKTNRKDLLLEEIAPAIRIAARNMISALPARTLRQSVLVAELSVLWANPRERLNQVASSEPTLIAELNGGHLNADGTVWKDKEGDDTKSEFSIVSRQSGASYTSSASRSSVRSSASSSVSILSNLSVGSSGGRSAASTTAFSIDGLDHSLLSRGAAKGPGGSEVGGKKEPPRKYKRRQRKTGKGEGGRDVWGLRREAAVCAELWSLAQVSSIASSAKDLCDVLSLFSLDAGDVALACTLQMSVDTYVKELQARPPPVAPMYPPQWMQIRQLVSVCRYQEILYPVISIADIPSLNEPRTQNDEDEHDTEIIALAKQFHYNIIQEKRQSSSVDTWWKTAADGILLWQSFRRITLES